MHIKWYQHLSHTNFNSHYIRLGEHMKGKLVLLILWLDHFRYCDIPGDFCIPRILGYFEPKISIFWKKKLLQDMRYVLWIFSLISQISMLFNSTHPFFQSNLLLKFIYPRIYHTCNQTYCISRLILTPFLFKNLICFNYARPLYKYK